MEEKLLDSETIKLQKDFKEKIYYLKNLYQYNSQELERLKFFEDKYESYLKKYNDLIDELMNKPNPIMDSEILNHPIVQEDPTILERPPFSLGTDLFNTFKEESVKLFKHMYKSSLLNLYKSILSYENNCINILKEFYLD